MRSPVVFENGQQIEVLVASGDLEANAGGPIVLGDELAVSENAMHQIDGGLVQRDDLHGASQQALELSLQIQRQSSSARRADDGLLGT